MKTIKAFLILLAGAGFATPVFGASDSRCISAAFANGHVEIRNKCNRDVHYLYCVVNPSASSSAYDCAGGGGSGRLAAGKKAALKVPSRKGTKTTFRWFACANPRIAEKWDSMGNRGICRNPGASAAAPGSTRDDRRALQTALKTEGFNPGPADGIFGSGTRAAIKAWQESIGQAATGQLTEVQIRLLLPRRQWAQAAVMEPAAGGTWESPAGEPAGTEHKAEAQTQAQTQESGDGCPGDVTVGTYRYPTSGTFTGSAGHGVLEYLYTGEMCNGKPNGKGEISKSVRFSDPMHAERWNTNGEILYRGEMKNGRPHGNGTEYDTYPDPERLGRKEFSGEWREGLPVKGTAGMAYGNRQMHDGPNGSLRSPDLWNLLRVTVCNSIPLSRCLRDEFEPRKILSESWQLRESSGAHYVGE